MPAKPVKIPTVKNMKANKEQGGWLSQMTSPKFLAIVVAFVVLAGVVMAFTGPDEDGFVRTTELRNFDSMLKRFGVRRRGVDIMCNASSRAGTFSKGCYTFTKTQVPRGEIIMKIPQELIIDTRFIMGKDRYRTVLEREENSTFDSFIKVNHLEQAYYFYIYVHWIVSERNLGSSSEYAEWFSMLPKEDEMTTGLQWSPSDDECLDEASSSELAYFRALLEGMEKVGQYICQGDRCTQFSVDDLRWGLSIYRSRNIQDQAIVIPFDFINHAQDGHNTQVEWNQAEKVLDVKLMANSGKGEEVLTHYGWGKSPMNLLLSHGFVEDSTTFFPSQIAFDSENIPLFKKLGCDRKFELGYGSTGRPRALLISCLQALVMSEEQREQYKTIIAKKGSLELLEINMYTYGNLSLSIQKQTQKSRPSQEARRKCSDRATPGLALAERMQKFTLDFLIKIYKFCSQQYQEAQKRYVEAGGVLSTPGSSGSGSSGAGRGPTGGSTGVLKPDDSEAADEPTESP